MTIYKTKDLKNELKNTKREWTLEEINSRLEVLGEKEKSDTTPKEQKEMITSLYLAFEEIKERLFPTIKETPKKENVEKFENHSKKQKTVIQDEPKKKTISFEEHLQELQDLYDKGIYDTMEIAKNAATKTLKGYIKSYESQILEMIGNPENLDFCQSLEKNVKLAKDLLDKITPPTPKKEHAVKIDTLTLDYSDMYKLLKTDEKEFAEICLSLEYMQKSYLLNSGCIPFIILSILQGKETDVLFQEGKDMFNSKSVLYRTEKLFYNVHFVNLLKKHFSNELVWNWIKDDNGFFDIADYVLSNYKEEGIKEETEKELVTT